MRAAAGALLLAALPAGAWDLSQAEITRLDNGLTLLVLATDALPVVSVQMLYRVGARDEEIGRTGLAHFLEHMAFRASENFPDTEVVSAIYAVGGEWHGYTWLDETTYFATVPAQHLDLLLRIEADRMARLLIPEAEVEAERGAILAEMHGYENDPAAVLKDTVVAISFLQHPYRNNTIGWESDVETIRHRDLVEFWRRHYRPANAVLAVAGRVSAAAVSRRVRELFGELPAGEPTRPPAPREPPQTGLRRVDLRGGGPGRRFEIAYRAPAVTDPDYPAFLLLQQVLAGGAGVNFLQNTWGEPVRPGSRLAGIAADLVTWYPPTAFPYVFTIAGSAGAETAPAEIESRLEQALGAVRERPPAGDELQRARRALLDELVYDLETTEDAAHQLAYFEGLGGLGVLLRLPASLSTVTPHDLRRVASAYLQPHQRTIGWMRPAAATERPRPRRVQAAGQDLPPASQPGRRAEGPAPPRAVRLAGGLPLLFRRVPLSPAAYLRILVPTTGWSFAGPATANEPVWRHTSIQLKFRPDELAATLRAAREVLRGAAAPASRPPVEVDDPASRLELAFDELLGLEPLPLAAGVAAAVVLVGDLRASEALPAVEEVLGDLRPARAAPGPLALAARQARLELTAAKAQARLGYVVPAPSPADPDGPAWRLLLYVLSHGYEGRLGKEAISRQGLVYSIEARYRGDGRNGRVTLSMGVDPRKLRAMATLLRQQLAELGRRPPTGDELAEAKAHLLGRRVSSAQSNEEISAALAEEWIVWGRLLADEEYAAVVRRVTLADLQRILPAFISGAVVEVAVGR